MTALEKEDLEKTKDNARKLVKNYPLDKIGRKFAFYGSLREGHYNFTRLVAKDDKRTKDGVETIRGFKMFDLGSFPFVSRTNNDADSIIVELYTLSDPDVCRYIHMMEVGAGYGVEEVTINDQVYWLYVYPERDYGGRGYPEVKGGDWTAYKKR